MRNTVTLVEDESPAGKRHDDFAGKRDGRAFDRHEYHNAEPAHEVVDIAGERQDERFERMYQVGDELDRLFSRFWSGAAPVRYREGRAARGRGARVSLRGPVGSRTRSSKAEF